MSMLEASFLPPHPHPHSACSDGTRHWVLILPYYGPVCFALPTDADKDRVYDYYYLKVSICVVDQAT